MDIIIAILGTFLVTIGAIVVVVRRAYNAFTANVNGYYQAIGKKKFLFIPCGKWIQEKIRKLVEDFCKEIFKDEPEEEKEKKKETVSRHFTRLRYGLDAERQKNP